ncbi:hypothetical protein DFH28DRAFT_1132572 [Melampsora americana]|nr:hypothetical protein DFH28DRAFT_1132572 [Melampsora americana]
MAHRYFSLSSTEQNNPRWRCLVCGRKDMVSYEKHRSSQSHQKAVARYEAQEAVLNTPLPALEPQRPPSPIPSAPHDGLFDDSSSQSPTPEPPPSPLSARRAMEVAHMVLSEESDNSDLDIDIHKIAEAINAMDHGMWEEEADEALDEAALEADLCHLQVPDLTSWYPFKKKEHIVALLIIGSTRSILSRSQYHRIRSILHICNVRLPEWAVLRALSNRLKRNLGLEVSERRSALGTPLFGLKVQTIISNELANPLISPHLVCLPQLPKKDEPINRFAQSQKWREGFPTPQRVQMVASGRKHFYIYEPVQLFSQKIVVPVFFFLNDGRQKAKCVPASVLKDPTNPSAIKVFIPSEPPFTSNELSTVEVRDFWRITPEIMLDGGHLLHRQCGLYMYQETHAGLQQIPLTNPWRTRAHGRAIKHIPIALYSDDTSGNVSKKWNKHMSIFFTLAGLPPKMTNQEYNIHFLATSNCASVLDLLDEVVEDINVHASEGFVTYDQMSGTDVLVMVVVLCHLGDSPMHAEISNTTNPANTLTPCRMCDLSVARMADKKSLEYVSAFVGLSLEGHKQESPKRDWDLTRARTHDIWVTATGQRPSAKRVIEDKRRQFGLRDSVLDGFLAKVWAFDSPENDGVKELCDHLHREFGARMFNPMLRLKGFDGHQDTPVETLHVVLLGITKYLFRDTMKNLGILNPSSRKYINISARWRAFNTKGLNLPPIVPNTLIQFYQSLVGKDFQTVLQSLPFVLFDFIPSNKRPLWTHSAQWVNKPKVHMLTHLQDSIKRFGPANLFMTQKFESYNGVLRSASVHSNRQSPGRDIANSFNNYQLMRALLSGSTFFDKELQARVAAGPRVQELLHSVPELSQAMGLDPKANQLPVLTAGTRVREPEETPGYLITEAPHWSWFELASVTLRNKQHVEKGDFVKLADSNELGQVAGIWAPDQQSAGKIAILFQETRSGEISPFYGMREISRINRKRWVNINRIDCIINMQHNCHRASCPVTKGQTRRIERRDTEERISAIAHIPTDDYVVNSTSHYSAEKHRQVANIPTRTISPDEWITGLQQGLKTWHTVPVKPRKTREPKTSTGKTKEKDVEMELEDSDWDLEEIMAL